MAERITQKLGFDASQAIDQLRKLQTQLKEFRQGLSATSGSLRKFTVSARPAIATFRTLATSAAQAKTAMSGISKAAAVPGTVATSAKKAATSLQTLGTQAETSSSKVKTSTTSAARVGSTAVAALGGATSRAAKTTSQAASTSKIAWNTFSTSVTKAGKAGTKAANDVTISWQTVLRVIQAQIIVRALSTLVSIFTDSQTAAAEFSMRIGEISTISTGALGPLDQISQAVRELSVNLGLSAADVAEGLYQTLSNQVVEAGNALRFEAEAAKLAIATNSELKSAVNALSSVMNSYNLNVAQTSQVSDVLFTTIELGRLRLSEFGDVLGRVAPLTEALGVSWREMAASIAALTQKGVPAHTAITQLTQVSQKLLRPTEALQKLYKQWGVETGPEAIRRFGGLTGVLMKMKDASAGNNAAFGDFLGRVRALVGGLNLTTNEANAVTEALIKMETSAGTVEEKFQLMEKTIGRRAVKAWNKLQVQVLTFGEGLLEITTPILEAIGSMADNITLFYTAFVAAGSAVIILSKSLKKATFSMVAFRASLSGLWATIAPLLPVLVALGAALAVVKWYGIDAGKAEAEIQRLKRAQEDLTRTHEAQARKRIDATEKQFREQRKLTGDMLSEVSKLYAKSFVVFEALNEAFSDQLEGTLKNLFSTREKGLNELLKAGADADASMKASANVILDTQRKLADLKFGRDTRGMGLQQKFAKTMLRASKDARKAREAYAKAGVNVEAKNAALVLSNIAEKRAGEARALAERIGHLGQIRQAERALDKVLKGRITAEKRYQAARKAVDKDRVRELQTAGLVLQQLFDKAADQLKLIRSGSLKTVKEQAKAEARLLAILGKIVEISGKAWDFGAFDDKKFQGSMVRVRDSLVDALATARYNFTAAGDEFQKELESREIQLKLKRWKAAEEIFGVPSPLEDVGVRAANYQKFAEDTIKKYEDANSTITQGVGAVDLAVQGRLKLIGDEDWKRRTSESQPWSPLGSQDVTIDTTAEKFRKKLIAYMSTLKAAAAGEKVLTKQDEVQLTALKGKVDYLRGRNKLTAGQATLAKEVVETLEEERDRVQQIHRAREAMAKITEKDYYVARDYLEYLVKRAGKTGDIKTDTVKTAEALARAKESTQKLLTPWATMRELMGGTADDAERLRSGLQKLQELETLIELQDLKKKISPKTAAPAEKIKQPKPDKITQVQPQNLQKISKELNTIATDYSTINIQAAGIEGTTDGAAGAATNLASQTGVAVGVAGKLGWAFGVLPMLVGAVEPPVKALNEKIIQSRGSIEQTAASINILTQQLANSESAAWGVESAMNAIASAARAAADAINAIPTMPAAPARNGGPAMRYMQAGGFTPRGNDRQPVMAAAGEFFVNARSARNFASELQAINAGVPPVYRDKGGSVTTVGDINVTMHQGAGAQPTAREVANALRRELRRKTSRL